MKIFLGLLIFLPLLMRADTSVVSIRQSPTIDAFFKTSYQLSVGDKVSESAMAFEIRLRGVPNVPCDTDHLIPDAILISDNKAESLFFIQLNLVKGNPTPGCFGSKPFSLESVAAQWYELHTSSGHVSFVTPENVKLDIRKARVLE